MTFEEILDQAIAMLQRRGRVTYRALQRQFNLDDAFLDDLKEELIHGQQLVVDEDGKVLVWSGGADSASTPAPSVAFSPAAASPRAPLSYTPPYLTAKILDARPRLEGERKQVTVLFADIKESTELIRDLDPEAAQQLLDPALQQMMDAVHRFEGTVNQVLGDGIMALFGAPIAHEDHALRACYTALAMQAAMREYTEEVRRTQGLELRIRVGLNAGEVVVRAIGNDLHMDYSAVGQTTHLAARMEQLATPGSIRLTASTLRLVEGLVQVNTLGPIPVKGLAEPVEVFELVGASAVRRRLQAIAELPEAALPGVLAHLQAAEFLYETRLFPHHEYTFKHALTHEVAYGSLLLERRRVLHAQIVEALEAFAGDRVVEQVERLAHHAWRGEVWGKAVAYCQQAGEKATARSAYREAVGYFEQALNALPHLPEQRDRREQAIDLRLALSIALRPLGDFGRILTALHEAETLAEALDDPRRLGRVSSLLSNHFRSMGAYDQAIAAAQRALALATVSGEVALPALAHQVLGYAYHAQGDYRRAIDCFGQTVASLEGARRRERFGLVFLPAVQSRAWLAVCHAELGTFAEGAALGDEGLRIAEAVAHPASLMFASWGIGLLCLRQGDLPRAILCLERAVGICQAVDLPVYFPKIAAAAGTAYTLAGRSADAVSLLTQAMEQSTAMARVDDAALCSLSLGEAQMLAGRLEEAQTLTERALARAHQERSNQAYALRLLGEIAAHREPPENEQAESYYQQTLALADELGMRPLAAHCHLGLGMFYCKIGRKEPARAELSAAIALYRAMDMTFWLPQAEG